MGLRGPAKTPTALRVIRGNPSHRPLPRHEPKPRETRPHCPEHVRQDAVAFREWRRLQPILRRMRVLTEADYIALGNLCQTYSTMIAAQQEIAKLSMGNRAGGLIIVTGRKKITRKHQDGTESTTETPGFMQISPLLSIVRNCIIQITGLCREFGLTPASRPNLKASPAPKPEDEWADL